jgi:isochorismate hydrolase
MINSFEFQHGHQLAKKAEEITPNIMRLKRYFKKHKLPVIYINDFYQLTYKNRNDIIQYCMNPISKNIINKLYPSDDDYFIPKPNYSGFFQTSLQQLLVSLSTDQLILTGIAGNRCVLFTANDAFMYKHKLFIPNDTITSITDEDHQLSLKFFKDVLQASTEPFSDISNKI